MELQKKKPESARQFDEIWRDHNDPQKIALKKLVQNRRKKIEEKQNDAGL